MCQEHIMNTTDLLPPTPAAELAQRLDGIFASIVLFLFGRIQAAGDLIYRLSNRFARARRRLANLLALLAAGRLPRVYAPRPDRKPSPRPFNYPRRRAWMQATFGYRIAAYGSHLDHLLRDPDVLALLAVAPPAIVKSAARTLRPLCHLFGVDLPPILRPAAKPPRRKPVKPPLPPLPPLLPLHPQARPRDLPFLRFPARTPPRKIRPA